MPKRRYVVYWRADDGDHRQGFATAYSKEQAINFVSRREPMMASMLGNLYAKPLAPGESAPPFIPAAVPAVKETLSLQPQSIRALAKSNLPKQMDLF